MTIPTDEAVERVAKAIFREDFPTGHKRGEWRKVSDAMRENYRAAARAAIAAMQPSVAAIGDMYVCPDDDTALNHLEASYGSDLRCAVSCMLDALRALSKETDNA